MFGVEVGIAVVASAAGESWRRCRGRDAGGGGRGGEVPLHTWGGGSVPIIVRLTRGRALPPLLPGTAFGIRY